MTRLMLALIALLAAPPAFAQGADWPRADRHDGVHLRILNDYELPAGATAWEPIVVIGGSAVINGRAEDDVVVIGGTLRIGPTAVIAGDVAAIGTEATIDPAARISGDVDRTTIVGPDIDLDIGWISARWWTVFAFGATLLRLALVLVIAVLLIAVAPGWITAIADRAHRSPLASAGVGIAAQVLFVPMTAAVTVALLISIVGILLLLAFPFALGALALLWVAGFAAVAINVGSRLRGGDGVSTAPLRDLLVGFLLISAVTLVAHFIALASTPFGPAMWAVRAAGWTIEWIAWTVGLGAALAVLLGPRHPVTPPPPPLPLRTAAPTTP